jgi:hypothetical protein
VVLIDAQSSAKQPAAKNYGRISDINPLELEAKLSDSSLFMSPTSTAKAFAKQMENVVVSTLDELAPLRKFQRRPSKNVTRWLLPAAIDAKRSHCRSYQHESDRVAYRACRSACELIQASRRAYFHPLQRPHSGLSQNTCCVVPTRLFTATTASPVACAGIF